MLDLTRHSSHYVSPLRLLRSIRVLAVHVLYSQKGKHTGEAVGLLNLTKIIFAILDYFNLVVVEL